MKRTNHALPSSCYVFLGVLKQLLMLGFTLSHELFYVIIEKTIEKEDHKDIVVHRAVKALRDELGIDSDVFLSYLEQKSISPCPELLTQVRHINIQKKRKERVMEYKRQSLRYRRDPPPLTANDIQGRDSAVLSLTRNKSLGILRENSEDASTPDGRTPILREMDSYDFSVADDAERRVTTATIISTTSSPLMLKEDIQEFI